MFNHSAINISGRKSFTNSAGMVSYVLPEGIYDVYAEEFGYIAVGIDPVINNNDGYPIPANNIVTIKIVGKFNKITSTTDIVVHRVD